MTDILKEVIDRVSQLEDPETRRHIGDINLLTEVKMVDDSTLKIIFTPNSPYSPTAVNLGLIIKNATQNVNGVRKVIVECVGHMMDDLVNKLVNED